MAHILVTLELATGQCAAYFVPRSLCERAVKIGKKRGLPALTELQYARLLAIAEAKADGVPLSPKIAELRECER